MSNFLRTLTPAYVKDVLTVRQTCEVLTDCSLIEVDLLWRAFSRERCATFLVVDAESMAEFREWLED